MGKFTNPNNNNNFPARPPSTGGTDAAAVQRQRLLDAGSNVFRQAFAKCVAIDRDGFVNLNELTSNMLGFAVLAPFVEDLVKALQPLATRAGRVQYQEYLQAASIVLQQQSALLGHFSTQPQQAPLPFGQRPIGYNVQAPREVTSAVVPQPQWNAPWSRPEPEAQPKQTQTQTQTQPGQTNDAATATKNGSTAMVSSVCFCCSWRCAELNSVESDSGWYQHA